jgi:septal ring factor EnvC (AmiA/AmiB activator)
MRWAARGLAACVAAAWAPGVASARPAAAPAAIAAQLRAAEQQRQAGLAAQLQAAAAAQAAQRRADQLAEARVAAAARLRAAEEATDAAAIRMSDLAAQRREAERRLAQQAANLGPLLPLIERLALYPLETLLAIPADPQATLLGVTVLQGITRDMERQAEALTRQRAAVARLTASMQAEAPLLAAAQQEQANQAASLDAQLDLARARVTAAERIGLQAAQQAAAAASRADSLRDAIAQIEAEQARAAAQARAEAAQDARARRLGAAQVARARAVALSAPAGPGLAAARGALGAPVAGAMVRGFGAQTEAGPASGISYQPPPSARVISPCGGKVVFSGPFRSYGLLLIVDCGGGYDFVLAGLDRLDAPVGHTVRQGEPVGIMPAWDPRSAGGGAGLNGAGRPALYVELRHNGAAIDPAPFLRAHL